VKDDSPAENYHLNLQLYSEFQLMVKLSGPQRFVLVHSPGFASEKEQALD